MSSWLLLAASFVCAWLAYDAWRLAGNDKNIPEALTAKWLGQNVTGVPLHELEERRRVTALMRYGLGDPNGAVWLWAVLALAFMAGSIFGFFIKTIP